MVKKLIQLGADVNAQNAEGKYLDKFLGLSVFARDYLLSSLSLCLCIFLYLCLSPLYLSNSPKPSLT
jgi:hypothetical protein